MRDHTPADLALQFPESLDVKFLDICKEAISEMYLLWREIDRLPSISEGLDVSGVGKVYLAASDLEKLASTMNAVDSYDQTFNPFMRQCFEHCSKLSIRTRAFSGETETTFTKQELCVANLLSSVPCH